MSNQRLVAAIAGQADWLQRMSATPLESQQSPSIVELAAKRRDYIARLCLEVVSRGSVDGGPKYPGASKALSIFSETVEYAEELEASGIGAKKAAVSAVKEKLFTANGAVYPASWET
jgi:hypothetical protein